jgi:hypothetical protein
MDRRIIRQRCKEEESPEMEELLDRVEAKLRESASY